MQGLFELAGIPLVGCGVLASALCMDKDRAHKLVQAAGVAIPHSIVLERYRCDSAVCKNATKRNNERCLTTGICEIHIF